MVDEVEGGGADGADQSFRLTGLDAVDAVFLDRTATVGGLEPGHVDAAVLEQRRSQGLVRWAEGAVEGGEEAPAILEARDSREGALGVEGRAHAGPGAAVGETDHGAAAAVDLDVHEVQEVAAAVGAAQGAAGADGAALDGIAGSGVDGRPGGAAVIGVGHVEIPDGRARRIVTV